MRMIVRGLGMWLGMSIWIVRDGVRFWDRRILVILRLGIGVLGKGAGLWMGPWRQSQRMRR